MKTFTYKSKYGTYKNCYFNTGRYENGNLAVEVWSNEEGPITRVTVNPDITLPDDLIAIKNYSENEGTVNTLIEMGIIIDVPFMTIPSGFIEIPVYGLTEKGKEMLGV